MNVGQSRVRVGVHGQVNRRVPHCGLRRSRCDPALAQERAERMAKGVNVHGTAAVVALRNTGHGQILVEGADQPARHVEQWRIAWQLAVERYARQRQARPPFRRARIARIALGQVFDPQGQVVGKVATNGQHRAVTILFVAGLQNEHRHWPFQVKLAHSERSELTTSKPGEHQHLVNQRTFAAEQFQSRPHVAAELGNGQRPRLYASRGERSSRRATAGGGPRRAA